MKEQWDKYVDQLSVFGDDITELLNALKPGPKTDKIIRSVNSRWEKLRKQTELFGQNISPIDPEEITLPYQSSQFENYWKKYKDFLQEEHHIFMKSRRENEMLKVLRGWAGDSDKKALEILSFLIRSGYRGFFRPTDKQMSGDEPATVTEEQQYGINIKAKTQI